MARELTARQRDILDYIADYIEQRGFPPTIREIGSHFGIGSLRGVTVHLDALSKKGWIVRGRSPRSIRLTSPERQLSLWEEKRVPIVRRIAGGLPVSDPQDIEDYIPVPDVILAGAKGAIFAFRIRDDSMIAEHILPGDIAIACSEPAARSGELAAALIGEEIIVRRLKMLGNRAILLPANPAYDPIEVEDKEPRIPGKVIGLIRVFPSPTSSRPP